MSKLSFGIAYICLRRVHIQSLGKRNERGWFLEATKYFAKPQRCYVIIAIHSLIWDNVETIDSISSVLLKAISQGCYDK